MKKKFLSFLACLSCCIFCLSPVSAFGATLDWVEIIAETVFSALVQGAVEGEVNGSDGKGLTGVAEQFIDISLVPAMYDKVAQTAGNLLTFTIPNYRLVTGKYQFKSTFAEYSGDDVTSTTNEDVLVECTLVVSDSYPNNFDFKNPFGVDKNTGVAYYANSLNYSIYYSDGTIDRFVCVFRNNVYSKVSGFGTSFVSLSGSNYCDVYDYSATKLQRELYTNQWTHGVRYYMNESNTINQELSAMAPRPDSPVLLQYPVALTTYGSTGSSKYSRLLIKQWVEGRAGAVYLRPSSYTGSNRDYVVTFYPNDYYYTSFAITNNNSDENRINSGWTTNNYQNYYVDNVFEGGKVINNDNKTTILGGALAPAFDIDTDLPFDEILDLLTDLLPDIKANLKPEIGFDIESLFDRLFDFYSNMPDIGLPWGDDDTNNYWDVEPPALPDHGGGGGDITVNVEITRPLVPEVVTSFWLSVDVSTETTATYPVAVVSAAPELWNKSDDILNTLDLMPVYGLLALVGVAVAVLYKGV